MSYFNRILDQKCNVYLQTNYQIYIKSVNACNSYRGFSEVTPKTKVSTIDNHTDI